MTLDLYIPDAGPRQRTPVLVPVVWVEAIVGAFEDLEARLTARIEAVEARLPPAEVLPSAPCADSPLPPAS